MLSSGQVILVFAGNVKQYIEFMSKVGNKFDYEFRYVDSIDDARGYLYSTPYICIGTWSKFDWIKEVTSHLKNDVTHVTSERF